MQRLITLLVIFLLFGILLNAQNYVFEGKVASDNAPIDNKLMKIVPSIYGETMGDPYLYNRYRVGFIWFQDSFYKLPQVKYNLFENRLEIIEMGKLVSFPTSELQCFALLNPFTNVIEHFYNAEEIKFKEVKVNGFLQKIKAKDYNLFVFHESKLKLPSENLLIMGQGPSPRFTFKKHFYLEKRNWLYVMRNKRDVHEAMHRKHLKKALSYTKRHKLRFKETEDFLTLFTYLEKVEVSL